ncbi:phosphotransacetylase family protein [Desulfothermus sp.]
MIALYIGSTSGYAGKTLITLTIGRYFQNLGFKVGFIKPVGTSPATKNKDKVIDQDALFIQKILGLNNDPELVTPVVVTRDLQLSVFKKGCPDFMGKILNAYEKLKKDNDLMLISGSGSFLHAGKYCNVAGIDVANALEAKVILIDRFFKEFYYDYLVSAKEILEHRLIGCILNSVPKRIMDTVNNLLLPLLNKKDIDVLGVIPKDPFLYAIPIKELAKRLKGNIISGQNKLDELVIDFIIGTMQIENFMYHYQKKNNPAVIVGGDRSDLQLVALEGRCKCLILTGNIYPTDIILNRAKDLNIPILVVKDDTYTIAKKMDFILETIKLRDEQKLNYGFNLVKEHIDWTALKKRLGLEK